MAHSGKLVMLDWQTYKKQKIIDYIKKHPLNLNENSLSENSPHELNKSSPDNAIILNTIEQINDYVAGKRQVFDIEMDVSIGTPFQQKVWQALQNIPYGQTISYAQLAQNIGQPSAFRAVAHANAKNPISLLIPCHRVIASDGGLGGYTGGIAIKQALLAVETPIKWLRTYIVILKKPYLFWLILIFKKFMLNITQTLTDTELLRYSRQILLDGWDIDAQTRLKNSRIFIIGMGGLGCPVADTLVRAGVGELFIVDSDMIEASNLQRQSLFTPNDIGKPKVTTAQQRLNTVNELVNVTAI